MARVLIGALVAGIVLFAWQWAAWTVLEIHKLDADPLLKQEDAVVAALDGEARGVYWIPGAQQTHDTDSPEYKAWEEKYKRGPRGFLIYDPEGADPMDTRTMLIGGATTLLIGLVLALMVRGARHRTFLGRWLLVIGVGLVLALVMDVQGWNWQNMPDDWTRGYVIEHVAGMAIVGFLLALIVKRTE